MQQTARGGLLKIVGRQQTAEFFDIGQEKGTEMSKASRMVAAALALAVSLGGSASFAADGNWESTMMKPTRAKSLDVGTKHVISYFVSADGACRLTAMIADRSDDEAAAGAAQLQLTVEPGKTARIATADGNSLRFICLGRAEWMTATVVNRVALGAPAQ
ncbi:hypothetical protein DSM21852_25290 [Methylocystis bryophila]|nr:hypothetical protein DSM21852_25290 [Methylocystis bryophila]